MRPEGVGIPFAVHPNHQGEPAVAAGLNPGKGILHHHGPWGLNPEHLGGLEEGGRRRFTGKFQVVRHLAVNPGIKEIADAAGLDYGQAMPAR